MLKDAAAIVNDGHFLALEAMAGHCQQQQQQ
jgi:hypothetical protein